MKIKTRIIGIIIVGVGFLFLTSFLLPRKSIKQIESTAPKKALPPIALPG